MSHRVLVSMSAMAVVVALVSSGAALATAQTTVPRTPWGQPDLQGVWDFRTITPLQRPEDLAEREFLTEEEAADLEQSAIDRDSRLWNQAARPAVAGDNVGAYNNFWMDRGLRTVVTRRTSLIVGPPNGRLPSLTPRAEQLSTSPEAERVRAVQVGDLPAPTYEDFDAGDRCIQHAKAGPPISVAGYNNNIQIFQTPNHVAILNEQNHDVRVVPLDGRPHVAPAIRQWMGDSRGHWEGQTLVVETVHFNGKHDQIGRPLLNSGENLALVERFTRPDRETLMYEYTVTDPTIWTEPWTVEYPMRLNPDLIYEFACHEGNYGMYNILAGSRMEEAAKSRD